MIDLTPFTPEAGPAFYALLDPATVHDGVNVVTEDGEQYAADSGDVLCVTREPRRLPLSRSCDVDLRGLLTRGECLARLTPRGDVTRHPDGRRLYICTEGWAIAGWQSPDLVLGPQAAQLRAVMDTFSDLRGSGPIGQAYARSVNASYDEGRWLPQVHADAAQAALDAAGCDGRWWAWFAEPCFMRGELAALAARDLLGSVPGWNWRAYATLMRSWGTAVGRWAHPQDADCAQVHWSMDSPS
ncbi:hypothetical protein [Actinomadura rudentiformis]|uniref:hypothetical protein n=1 Tax=Actinomadura rudentiformis TaxID=359158 RepID=UPI00178C45FE|nr:hypothetical protein [Actinomadura rudentiformis]